MSNAEVCRELVATGMVVGGMGLPMVDDASWICSGATV